MNELDGIKDFIEANKESLENMNKEMIARCSQVPLVYLTLDEAKALNNLILKLFYNEENRMSVFDATELLTKRIGQAENK